MERREPNNHSRGGKCASWRTGRRYLAAIKQRAFTLTIDKQDGRRFSGTFSSPRGSETVIAVISQSGTIYMVDDDGYNVATMLAPNRLEICYLLQSPTSRIASCTEFTKQP